MDHRWALLKPEKGRFEMTVQTYTQILVLAALTGLRTPTLIGDFTHLFANMSNEKNEKTTMLGNLETFQSDLKQLSQQIDNLNQTKRRWPFQSTNPGNLECSVSL